MGIHKIFLFSVICCYCLIDLIGATTDTLRQGQTLNSTDYLVSKNGLFTLGFYKIQTSSFNARYLGIWYTNYTDHPVWLANRNVPISDSSGVLAIDEDGRLKVTFNGGAPLELYSGPVGATNLVATLLNTGNLVVGETNPNGSIGQVLWQSFDYPTDALLPGMKLGVNHRTGQNWSLASWLTEHNPSPGAFTLEWDPNEDRLIVRHRGAVFWTTDKLVDNRFARIFMLDEANFNYVLTNVTSTEEEYLKYSIFVGQFTPKERRVVSKWLLTYDGSLVDGERPLIFYSDNCKGSNIDYGCKRWQGTNCRKDYDRFELRSGSFRDPKTGDFKPEVEYDNVSYNNVDCKVMCWKDCRCNGLKLYSDDNSSICLLYYGMFDQDLSGSSQQHYVLVPGPKSGKKRMMIIIITSVLVALAILALLCVLCYTRARKLKQQEKILLDLLTLEGESEVTELVQDDENKRKNLKVFSVASIMAATQNFSSGNKLGEGGFGPVFKGKLPEGQEVAVKILSRNSRQGLSEFKNELVLIAKLQHMNLVRLLGFCIHGEEKMLVYEYMPNKSLDCFIFDQSKRELLDWQKRFSIIEGIAQGILYLHKHSRLRIIHRDLKTSNILLDENMNPKISDFGLARICKKNESEANTLRPVGTYGYMPPEYAMEGLYSVKSDVYSFGVIMLETISGRKNNSFYLVDHTLNLVGHAWELWKRGDALELLDPYLKDARFEDQLLRCINIGLLCVEESASHRPTMSDVISMLASEVTQLPVPKHPAFFIGRELAEANLIKSRVENFSINKLSSSELVPR